MDHRQLGLLIRSWALVLVSLVTAPAFGQTVQGPIGQPLLVVASVPVTCDQFAVYVVTGGAAPGIYNCTSVNTPVPVFPAAVAVSGSSLPATCLVGAFFTVTPSGVLYTCPVTNSWQAVGVPQGSLVFVATGTCPVGFTEASALNGKMWRGTVAANGNVGMIGGADSVTPTFTGNSVTSSAVSAGTPAGTNGTVSFTPAGTNNAPTFTGSSSVTSAEVFTGNSVTSSAVTAGTPAGTNGTSATTGNCAATNVLIGTGAANACKATAPNLTVSAQTFTGSALGTHTHTTTATGTNGTGTVTPLGTVAAPTFTGSSGTIPAETFTGSALGTHTHTTTATGTISAVDTRAAYVNLIACQKS